MRRRSTHTMPSVRRVHRWWREVHPEVALWFGQWDDEPCCYGCRFSSPLDRAHLVDHARGGGDVEGNLVLLCSDCHRVMPSFGPDDYWHALAWVWCRPSWGEALPLEALTVLNFVRLIGGRPSWLPYRTWDSVLSDARAMQLEGRARLVLAK